LKVVSPRAGKTVQSVKSEELRSKIREWCQRVMNQRGWTARHWALQAGVASTTLTRFINNGEFYYTLSAATLDKLARAANATLDFDEHHPQQVYIPVFSREHLLQAIKDGGGNPRYVYCMKSDENIPVSTPFASCVFIRQDSGKLALCRNAAAAPGERVLVWCPDDTVAICFLRPPYLIRADNASQACRQDDPRSYVFGECIGELELFKSLDKG
jgi:transcriptional regulator with XRE-family HTH domain